MQKIKVPTFSCQTKKEMLYYNYAGIAQLVEQWIENPRVTSSTLVPGTLRVNNVSETSSLRVEYQLDATCWSISVFCYSYICQILILSFLSIVALAI